MTDVHPQLEENEEEDEEVSDQAPETAVSTLKKVGSAAKSIA